MPIIKILHLSDLHLAGSKKIRYKLYNASTGLVSVYNNNALIALAEFVYNRRKEIDAILISGDIAVTSDESDLTRALAFLDSIATLSTESPWLNSRHHPTLQTFAPKPIIVMPGNHDRLLNLETGWPGTLFYRSFSHYWGVGVGGVNYTLIPNRARPVLAILCCDFTLDNTDDATSKRGRWGQGKVYGRRLDELKDKTKQITNKYSSCAVLWMIHYAPNFEDKFALKEAMKLIDAGLLIEKAQDSEVEHILCGHTHLNRYYDLGEVDKIRVHCAGTSTCVSSDDDTTIHLRTIMTENNKIRSIETEHFTYNRSKEYFH